jgi:hypothetical protein
LRFYGDRRRLICLLDEIRGFEFVTQRIWLHREEAKGGVSIGDQVEERLGRTGMAIFILFSSASSSRSVEEEEAMIVTAQEMGGEMA